MKAMLGRAWAFGAITVLAAGCAGVGAGTHRSAPPYALQRAGTSPPAVGPAPADTAVPSPAVPATAIDTSVVPPSIDTAYADAVLADLNHVYGNAVRLLKATHTLPPSAVADLRAIYNDPLYNTELRLFSEALYVDFDTGRDHPGDPVSTVRRLITGTPTCIFVEVVTSLAAVVKTNESPAASEYEMLQPKQAGTDPAGLNTTPWAFSYDTTYKQPTTVASLCPAS
jgi:hypothetical protein